MEATSEQLADMRGSIAIAALQLLGSEIGELPPVPALSDANMLAGWLLALLDAKQRLERGVR